MSILWHYSTFHVCTVTLHHLTCLYCDITALYMSVLWHYSTLHVCTVTLQHFTCLYCDVTALYLSVLWHYSTLHIRTVTLQQYTCLYCDFTTIYISVLWHYNTLHVYTVPFYTHVWCHNFELNLYLRPLLSQSIDCSISWTEQKALNNSSNDFSVRNSVQICINNLNHISNFRTLRKMK